MQTEEQLILVAESGRARGTAGKTEVHRRGLLHRAFSIFLVDREGRLLVQRRAYGKYHSGGLWGNSCCGHPRPGERTRSAAMRRLGEELGVEVPLQARFLARYRAEVGPDMVENELVHVFFGRAPETLRPDPEEISEIRFLPWDDLDRIAAERPKSLAPWLRHYLARQGEELRQATRDTLGVRAALSRPHERTGPGKLP
ncbi:MAG TPA: isopentenyl-diphosphate Delta-isomerase [Allosphingosinicella sp.]